MATETDTRKDLLVDSRRSVRYHMRRVRFFDSWNRRISILSLIAGTAVATTLLAAAPAWLGIAFGASVAVLQAIDLVAGTAAKARLHSDLARSFVGLEREMTLAGPDAPLAPFEARRLEIEADEPPALRWLDILCHNEMSRSEFGVDAETFRVPWYQRLLVNWTDIIELKLERA